MTSSSFSAAQAFLRTGPSRPTLYKLIMPRVGNNVRDFLELFVSATAIPSIGLETAVALGQTHMGITRQQPTAVLYSKPLSIEVIGDSDYNAYKELRAWMDLTTEHINQADVERRTLRMNYYDTFVSDIQLVKLEQPDSPDGQQNEYKEPLTVKFINAYPVNISEVTLSSEAVNKEVRFKVDFTYESYSLTDSDNPLINSFSSML